ncbi:zinc finger protein 16-like isoform X1 [Oreochromis aureus]|uniref:zinc finger protein 16-like isoform X1 n=1 Tax=Oreochromis aureus TaxID=47969 RepID=UPI0019532D1F|nr:zinc finger protein 16-like isoform X1 [Oreochromis aureus]
MSSVQYLREFINERLTAAAEEIFSEFEKTIVQYEEVIDRQRRLLDITWKPEIKLHTAGLQQQHVYKEEEFLINQQLCNEENRGEPEPLQIKHEQEDFYSSQEEQQLALKEDIDTFMVTAAYEERAHGEPGPDREQILSHSFLIAEGQDQGGSNYVDLGSAHSANRSHSTDAEDSPTSEGQCNTDIGKKSVTCNVCGKLFKNKYKIHEHHRIHTGEKPYLCETCGKSFTQGGSLLVHMRTHSGEKPYTCNTCGERFCYLLALKKHKAVHTGENPFSCTTCGKTFTQRGSLLVHMRIHSGEKPYSCKTCGKSFTKKCTLLVHVRIHTGEKPYTCKVCGKSFTQRGGLVVHMKTHAGKKF